MFKLSIILVFILIMLVTINSHADYTTTIIQEATRQGIDPKLALAVAKVESNLNPEARGAIGEIGLFQIHPKYAIPAVYHPEGNIRYGIQQLVYWQKNCPVKEFVICYNQGFRKPKYPQLHPYFKKVMSAM